MKIKLKQIIVSSLAILMMISIGSNMISNHQNSYASTKSNQMLNLEKQEKYYLNKALSINQEITQLTTNHSLDTRANWYLHHDKQLRKKYKHNKLFQSGYLDGDDIVVTFNFKKAQHETYKRGWILSFVQNEDDDKDVSKPLTKKSYLFALQIFKQGKQYAQRHHQHICYYGFVDNSWSNN